MRDIQQLPISLKIIAAFYILNGFWNIVNLLLVGTVEVNGGARIIVHIVNIFAGFGLLELSPGWRKFCLVLCWIIAISSIVFLMVIATNPSSSLYPETPSVVGSIVIAFGFYVWQYRVLTSPAIRSLFRN